MKGPPTLFWIPMLGCSFHVLGKNDGRLMLVCQSTCVSNVSPNRTRRTAVLSPGSVNSLRAFARTSLTEIEFAQFQRPIRSGVLMDIVVCRLSWNRCRFWYVNPGDQVIHGVMLTAAGVRLIVGNVCEMLLFERSWDRLPPILSAPHENCFAKFKFDAMVDLTSHGLSEFR